MKRHALCLLPVLCAFFLTQCGEPSQRLSAPSDMLSQEVEALTGVHARVVWCQHVKAGGADPFAIGDQLLLCGLDTRDGKGDRRILSKPANYSRPLLSSDGEVILYTDKATRRDGDSKSYSPVIYRTDWSGSEPRKLTEGYAVDCWRDPATGTEWVYAVEDLAAGKSLALFAQRLVRFPLEHPGKKEIVYRDSKLSPDNIQLSRCGTMASGMAPWPKAGLLNLGDGGSSFEELGFGCWTSIAPDESGLFWVFDGDHREVVMHDPAGRGSWRLRVNCAPEMKDGEVYHPRWSNHPRFISVTGPYRKSAGEKGSVINQGGATADIYVGRLSADAKQVEGWVRITKGNRGDAFPDVWVEDGERADLLAEERSRETSEQPAS